MASEDKTLEEANSASLSSPGSWRERILVPTVLGGIAGAGVGLVSKYRKVHGLANISATYATNFAIVSGCYCGAREFVTASRKSDPNDLMNSAIAGFGTGAILGRLQAGPVGAMKYSIMLAVVGTTIDFATLNLRPALKNLQKNGDWLKLPEWSPIQVLDEEALAAKKAREERLYAQRNVHNLNKEKS
ncbi:hypothetical protein NMG60_11014269 [Bertholletia excelsa]